MWQHRQKERNLKRAETDIVQQQKHVQRSLKQFENSEFVFYLLLECNNSGRDQGYCYMHKVCEEYVRMTRMNVRMSCSI